MQRFDTVRRIAAVAGDFNADCVLVAGDVFDDNAVSLETLQLARDALETFSPTPVLLMPGNHDAAVPGSALERLEPSPHVRVLLDDQPVEVAGARFYPCPLRRRHEYEDPTRDLPARAAGEGPRIAVAHGGVIDFEGEQETPNLIDLERILEKGFDYVALGDWHGQLRLGPRAWYSGTPEGTRFKERDPGSVLAVEVQGPGVEPTVSPVAVGRTRWLRKDWRFDSDDDLGGLVAWLTRLEEKSWTLLDLRLSGALSLDALASLDAKMEAERARLLYLRLSEESLACSSEGLDVEAFAAEAYLEQAAVALRDDPRPEALDALRLLHRLYIGH